MPRDLVLGNGNLLINYDHDFNMRDLYFPFVGLYNHINGFRNGLGVWVDGVFKWVDSSWERRLEYFKDTNVTRVRLIDRELGIRLRMHGCVHKYRNIFLNRIGIENLKNRHREVRLLFYHDFRILESDIGDTAYYNPTLKALIHYKRDLYILVNAKADEDGLFQFQTGRNDSWRDMEDGELQMVPITQGHVDSAASLRVFLDGEQTKWASYWIAVGRNAEEVAELDKNVKTEGVEHLMEETYIYQVSWVNKEFKYSYDLDPDIVDLYKRSLLVIRTQIDNRGAILAANDTDYLKFNRDHYSYLWPRDGALVAHSLDLAGYREITKRFFQFCGRIIGHLPYFLHKYSPDGTLASSWHPWYLNGRSQIPIQEDETGLVLWALNHHYETYRDIEFLDECYHNFVRKCADFMVEFREPRTRLPAPSYDLWEERMGICTFTVSAVFGGLVAAAKMATVLGNSQEARRYKAASEEIETAALSYLYSEEKGRFLRMINVSSTGDIEEDDTVESSVAGVFFFGMLPADDPRVMSTMETVHKRLWVRSEIGGLARYEDDHYHQVSQDIASVPGNPWVICTLWMAEHAVAVARTLKDLDAAKDLLRWAVERQSTAGLLAEQYNPYTAEPLSVSPLTWSHATYCETVNHYIAKYAELSEAEDRPGAVGSRQR
jgi:oligosaccharide amylase